MQLRKHNKDLDFINGEVVKKYKGNYFASIRGTIYNLKFYRDIPLQPIYGTGYSQVYIQGKLEYVHQIIAKSFINNPYSYKDIHHINENKNDNRVENLMWISRANHQSFHIGAKIECNLLPIRFESISEASLFTELPRTAISDNLNGKRRTAGKFLDRNTFWYRVDNKEVK